MTRIGIHSIRDISLLTSVISTIRSLINLYLLQLRGSVLHLGVMTGIGDNYEVPFIRFIVICTKLQSPLISHSTITIYKTLYRKTSKVIINMKYFRFEIRWKSGEVVVFCNLKHNLGNSGIHKFNFYFQNITPAPLKQQDSGHVILV